MKSKILESILLVGVGIFIGVLFNPTFFQIVIALVAYMIIKRVIFKFKNKLARVKTDNEQRVIKEIKRNAERLLALKENGATIPTDLLNQVEKDRTSQAINKYIHKNGDKSHMIMRDDVYEIVQLYNQIDLLDATTYNDFLKLIKDGKTKIKDIPTEHYTQELCLAAVKTGSRLTDVPEKYINEEMCRLFIEAYPWNFYDIPEKYLTYDLCFEWSGMLHLGAIPEKFKDKAMCLKAMADYEELLCPYIEAEECPMDFIPDHLKADEDINTKANEIGWIGKYQSA